MTIINGDILNGASGLDIRETINARNRLQKFPAEFTLWDFTKFPINVYRDRRGFYSTDFDPKKIDKIKQIFDGVAAGTTKVVYADASKADNTGTGLTPGAAKQGIRQAVAVGEADGTATAVLCFIAGGEYPRSKDFHFAGGAETLPTKPTALIGWGGPVVIGPIYEGITFALDTGTAYKTSAARANVARVINRTRLDERGNGTPIAKAATKAAFDATTDDVYWHDTAGTLGTANILYVKRADGAAVSLANTMILGISLGDPVKTGAVSMYLGNITLVGGNDQCFKVNNTSSVAINAAAEDCQFLYPGQDGVNGKNCVSVDHSGLTALARCTYGYPINDAINPHGVTGQCHTLVIDGFAYKIGATPGTSCNLLTGHGSVTDFTQTPGSGAAEFATPVIAINFTGKESAGGAWRFIGASQLVAFGGTILNDRGDTAFGGSLFSLGISAENTAKIWAFESSVKGCVTALNATSGASVVVRSPVTLQGQSTGTGTITVS